MIEFMMTIFLGNLFVMAVTILLLGFMFVLRVMLNIWFDTDFMKRITEWFKKQDEKMKRKQEEYEKEQNVLLVVDEGEDNVPE